MTSPAHKLLCVTDSLGLAAAWSPPEGERQVSYGVLVQERASRDGFQLDVEVDAFTGRTAPMLVTALAQSSAKARWILLQVGVVDCAPRLLAPWQRSLVGRVRPAALRERIIAGLRALHRPEVFRWTGHRVMVSRRRFTRELSRAITLARRRADRVLVATILPTTHAKESVYVGFGKNVLEYNALVRKSARAAGGTIVDFERAVADDPERYVYDGVHPNYQGKLRMADALWDVLREDLR